MATRHYNYVFTTNNYDTTNSEQIIRDQQTAFIVYGYEVAPSTGTPHLQGYLEWKNAKTKSSTLKLLKNSWAELPNCDDPKRSIVYCCKNYIMFIMDGYGICFKDVDGNIDEKAVLEWGYVNFEKWYATPMENDFCFIRGNFKPKKMGKRTDLDAVKELVNNRVPLYEIAMVCSGFSSLQFAIKLYELMPPPKRKVPLITWIWGPTGCGKTYLARKLAKHTIKGVKRNREQIWFSAENLKWFPNYNQHPVAIIDDFRGHLVDWSFLLRITDVYPVMVPVKGGHVHWVPEEIYFTSNMHPRTMFEDWCESKKEDVNQLLRRLKCVYQLENTDDI